MNPILPFTVLAMFLPPQGPPIQTGPLQNSFLVATESVVDNALVIDPAEPAAQFDPQMRELKQSEANLKSMAQGDRQKNIADEATNMIFSISTCHIEARDSTKPVNCKSQVDQSIQAVMALLNHHKQDGNWIEGPPA